MFESFRKTEVVEPPVRMEMPDCDPLLRDEADPDPLVEEMVARLRDGLGTLVAIDEWGRPLAWRNVVRLALGPLASRLRDTEQALELAVSLIPTPVDAAAAEPADDRDGVVTEQPAFDHLAAHAVPEVTEPAVQRAEHEHPQESSLPTVEVILPASQSAPEAPVEPADVEGHALLVEGPVVVDEAAVEAATSDGPHDPAPSARVAPSLAGPARPAAASLFTISGDQRAVPVSPLGPGQLLRGGSADDSTTAKYDRFLTGLYGERQQVGGDEDRGSR